MALNDVEVRVGLQDNVSLPLKKIESSIIRFVGAVTAGIASVQAIAFPLREAAEFEQAMLNVAKTTGFSEVAVAGLSKELLALSTTLDSSAVDLANIAAIAGQLGLGDQGAAGIRAFTETTARFASVLDVTVETAAEGLAKIANIFNISLKEAEKISSAFNEVSNTSTASGEALLDIVRRLGNAGGTISLEQSLGLAATGVDFGLTLETIGTSFTKIFSNMQSRAGQFAEFMGTSTEEWAGIVEQDGVNALRLYLDKLNQVDSTTRAYTVRTLSGGGRIFSLVNKLLGDAANGYQILSKNIGNASGAFESGTSSIEEHQRVLTGVIAKLKILGNTVNKLATEIGTLSLPFLKEVVEDLTAFFNDPVVKDGFTQFAKSIGEAGKALVETARAIADLNINWANLAQIIKLFIGFKIAKFFVGMALAMAAQGKQLAALAGSWGALGATISGSLQKATAVAAANRGGVFGSILRESQNARTSLIKGWTNANHRLREVHAQYDTYVQNVHSRSAKAIARETAKLKAPGANITAIMGRINGQYRTAQTNLDRLNLARRVEVVRIRQSVIEMSRSLTPIALVARGFGTIYSAIKIVGGGIVRTLLGPWGFLIFTLGSSLGLFDKIGDALTKFAGFLGFSTKEQQEAARSARIAAAELKAEEDKVRSLSEAYQQFTKTRGAFTFTDANNFVSKEGEDALANLPAKIGNAVEGVNARLEELRINTRDAVASIDNIDLSVAQNEAALAASGERLKQAYIDVASENLLTRKSAREVIEVELARVQVIENQRKALIKQRGELQGMVDDYYKGFRTPEIASPLTSDAIKATDEVLKEIESKLQASSETVAATLADLDSPQETIRQTAEAIVAAEQKRVVELEKQRKAMLAQRKVQEAAVNTATFSSPISDAVRESGKEMEAIERAVAAGASEVSAQAADIALQYRTAEETLADLLKQKEKFNAVPLDDVANASPERLREIQALESQAKDLELKITLARNVLENAAAARAEFVKLTTNGGLTADAAFGLNLIESARSLKDAQKLAESLKNTKLDKFISDLTRAKIDDLNASIGWQVQNENLVRAFKRAADEATRTGASIHKAFKDVDKDIESLHEPLRTLQDDLSKIRKQRLIDRQFEKDKAIYEDFFNTGIENTRELKDAQIEAARANGDDRRAKFLERQRDAQIALAESQRDYLITSKAAAVEVDKLKEANKSLADISNELADLTKEADSAAAKGDLQRLGEISELITKKRDEAQRLNEIIAEGATKFAEGEFDVGSGPLKRSIIDQTQIDKIIAKAEDTTSKIEESFRAGRDALDKKADSAVAEVVGKYETLATKATETQAKVAALARELNLSPQDLEQIKEGWTGVSEVLDTVAKNLNATNIREVVGALSKIDETVFAEAKVDLEKKSQDYADTVQGIVSASAATAIEDLDGSKIQIATSIDAQQTVNTLNEDVASLGDKGTVKLTGEITNLKLAGDQNVNLSGRNAAQKNARGGYITGPGTGTSDSILSWLSNGEYVIDAATTRLFGSGFFQTLQSIARSGSGSIRTVLQKLDLPGFAAGGYVGLPNLKLGLPSFADGGLVGALNAGLGDLVQNLAIAQGAAPAVSERVELGISVGTERYTVQGSREQVKGLVGALKDISRSVRSS